MYMYGKSEAIHTHTHTHKKTHIQMDGSRVGVGVGRVYNGCTEVWEKDNNNDGSILKIHKAKFEMDKKTCRLNKVDLVWVLRVSFVLGKAEWCWFLLAMPVNR